MIILYIAVFAVYLMLFILARRKGVSMWAYLYEIGNRRRVFEREGIKERLLVLKPESRGGYEKEKESLRRYYTGKIKLFLIMILLGNTLAFLLYISNGMEGVLVDEKYIYRNDYGQGSRQTNLRAEIIQEDGSESSQDFVLVVEERRYEDVMVRQLAAELVKHLPDMILGSNTSLEEVRSDLELIQEAEGYPFRIEWESEDYSYLYSDGHITNEELEPEGVVVSLTAVLLYEDFREECVIPVHIFPPLYSQEELLKKKVQELLTNQETNSRKEEQMELPESVEGNRLQWSEKRDESSGMIFALLCVAAVLIYLLRDRELQKQIEDRNHQLLLDYPRLVSRMTLYLGAGMTIRNVFRKIAFDYRKEREAGGNMRYVYEEMLLTCYELDSGVSETVAYEHFGKRCRSIPYMKLSNLLVQNLRKGSNRIQDALRQEARTAFEDRKNMARKLGEEAGTKLLLPMMLMLGIVMVLIMIPAYFSFSV